MGWAWRRGRTAAGRVVICKAARAVKARRRAVEAVEARPETQDPRPETRGCRGSWSSRGRLFPEKWPVKERRPIWAKMGLRNRVARHLENGGPLIKSRRETPKTTKSKNR